MTVQVVVSVGTGGPFDRLVAMLDRWRRRNPRSAVWVQHAPGGRIPAGFEGAPQVPREELLSRMRSADVVVCHGGSGSVNDAIRMGHAPVVVPRRAHLGEHVINDHQLELVKGPLAARLITLETEDDLDAAIEEAVRRRRSVRDGGHPPLARTIATVVNASPSHPSWAALAWTVLGGLTGWVPLRRRSQGSGGGPQPRDDQPN